MMDPVIQKALFHGVIPVALAVMGAAVILGLAWRGKRTWRLGVWVGPVAAAVAVVVNFFGQDMHGSGRWLWVVPAVLAALVAWGAVMTPWPMTTRGRLTGAAVAAVLLAVVVGGLVWPTFYDDQAAWLRLLPPLAAALLAAALYVPAMQESAGGTALASSLAVGALAPVVVFSGNQSLGELVIPAAVVGGVLAIVSIILISTRFAPAVRELAAGAVGVALVSPAVASVAWSNGYELPPQMAWALVLAVVAPLLVWVGQLPGIRARWWLSMSTAILAVLIPAGLSVVLAATWVDVDAYQPPF